jgi:dienelactone hydrolase
MPALAFFGGQDFGPTPADARKFEAERNGSPTVVQIYPDAAHGFAEPGNPWGGWNEKTAEDSWTRAIDFLRQHVAKRSS